MNGRTPVARGRPVGTEPKTGGPYRAVTELLDRYHEALYGGQVSQLRETFHPTATYATAASGELLQLDLDAYLLMVAARASPESRGDPYGFVLEAIEFAGPTTALARVRSSMLGKRFVDFLSLLEVDGGWRIAAKVFHYDLITPAGGS